MKTVTGKRSGWLLFLIAATATLALAACGSNDKDKTPSSTNVPATDAAAVAGEPGVYQTLSMDEFADVVENRADDYLIINVHIPYAGETPNTDANIPYNDLDALTAAIPAKDAPVILYCRSGNMSSQAAHALVEQGYTQVWDVPGGMAAWQLDGHELIDQ